ncbi:MAG: mandelate racemase/muconate lactonizing enzyme family protein [Nitrososphaeria archaeon]
MKIKDVRCGIIAGTPVIRIDCDKGLYGLGQIEDVRAYRAEYIKQQVQMYKKFLVGLDPTDHAFVMTKINRLVGFKPWGSAVSAIEMALWDLVGKIFGIPVHKLLGGKVREKVRVYNSNTGEPLKGHSPNDYYETAFKRRKHPFGFNIFKFGVGFHGGILDSVPESYYGTMLGGPHPSRGHLTESGLKYLVECIEALRNGLGDDVGLALDCGPGFSVPSAVKFSKAVEKFNILWLEDLITGDYTPYTAVKAYKIVRMKSTIPIHTGEQICTRYGFKELIEEEAVDIIGPDPADCGGLSEIKWIAEHADLHQILIAPHSGLNGPIGLMASVHASSTFPANLIAIEFPFAPNKAWWESGIVKGLPQPLVENGYVIVPEKPGLGIELDENIARKYVREGDEDFFETNAPK